MREKSSWEGNQRRHKPLPEVNVHERMSSAGSQMGTKNGKCISDCNRAEMSIVQGF